MRRSLMLLLSALALTFAAIGCDTPNFNVDGLTGDECETDADCAQTHICQRGICIPISQLGDYDLNGDAPEDDAEGEEGEMPLPDGDEEWSEMEADNEIPPFECEVNGGICQAEPACPPSMTVALSSGGCDEATPYCCVPQETTECEQKEGYCESPESSGCYRAGFSVFPDEWDLGCKSLGGFCCLPDGQCVTEGGRIVDDGEKCCQGLTKIGEAYPEDEFDPDGGCIYPGANSFLCTYCGNGVCGEGENFCSCPDDCERPSERCETTLDCAEGYCEMRDDGGCFQVNNICESNTCRPQERFFENRLCIENQCRETECAEGETIEHTCWDDMKVVVCTCEAREWNCTDEQPEAMCAPEPVCQAGQILPFECEDGSVVEECKCLGGKCKPQCYQRRWIDSCTEEPLGEAVEGCRGCEAVCTYAGSWSEGWYDRCSGQLISYDQCATKWECVDDPRSLCEATPTPCEQNGGYCLNDDAQSCDPGFTLAADERLGCESGHCCLPDPVACETDEDCGGQSCYMAEGWRCVEKYGKCDPNQGQCIFEQADFEGARCIDGKHCEYGGPHCHEAGGECFPTDDGYRCPEGWMSASGVDYWCEDNMICCFPAHEEFCENNGGFCIGWSPVCPDTHYNADMPCASGQPQCCMPREETECTIEGGYCTYSGHRCSEGFEAVNGSMGCFGETPQCCMPVEVECRTDRDCGRGECEEYFGGCESTTPYCEDGRCREMTTNMPHAYCNDNGQCVPYDENDCEMEGGVCFAGLGSCPNGYIEEGLSCGDIEGVCCFESGMTECQERGGYCAGEPTPWGTYCEPGYSLFDNPMGCASGNCCMPNEPDCRSDSDCGEPYCWEEWDACVQYIPNCENGYCSSYEEWLPEHTCNERGECVPYHTDDCQAIGGACYLLNNCPNGFSQAEADCANGGICCVNPQQNDCEMTGGFCVGDGEMCPPGSQAVYTSCGADGGTCCMSSEPQCRTSDDCGEAHCSDTPDGTCTEEYPSCNNGVCQWQGMGMSGAYCYEREGRCIPFDETRCAMHGGECRLFNEPCPPGSRVAHYDCGGALSMKCCLYEQSECQEDWQCGEAVCRASDDGLCNSRRPFCNDGICDYDEEVLENAYCTDDGRCIPYDANECEIDGGSCEIIFSICPVGTQQSGQACDNQVYKCCMPEDEPEEFCEMYEGVCMWDGVCPPNYYAEPDLPCIEGQGGVCCLPEDEPHEYCEEQGGFCTYDGQWCPPDSEIREDLYCEGGGLCCVGIEQQCRFDSECGEVTCGEYYWGICYQQYPICEGGRCDVYEEEMENHTCMADGHCEPLTQEIACELEGGYCERGRTPCEDGYYEYDDALGCERPTRKCCLPDNDPSICRDDYDCGDPSCEMMDTTDGRGLCIQYRPECTGGACIESVERVQGAICSNGKCVEQFDCPPGEEYWHQCDDGREVLWCYCTEDGRKECNADDPDYLCEQQANVCQSNGGECISPFFEQCPDGMVVDNDFVCLDPCIGGGCACCMPDDRSCQERGGQCNFSFSSGCESGYYESPEPYGCPNIFGFQIDCCLPFEDDPFFSNDARR